MFDNIGSSPTIYVPAGSGEAYRTAQYWSDYADIIVEMGQPNDEIWYTSSDEQIVTPNATDVFGATIVSNTYENGKGVIKFDGAVTSFGTYAFRACRSLTSITIPDSVRSIGDDAFTECIGITQLTIPNSVTSIGNSAFAACAKLVTVSLSNSLTSIGEGVFAACTNLGYIPIPYSVTSIGDRAFWNCSGLPEITIPSSVTSIGKEAFTYCHNLRNIICKPATPPTGGSDMFSSIFSSATIYVPAGSGEAYRAAQYWSDYADIIVEKEM